MTAKLWEMASMPLFGGGSGGWTNMCISGRAADLD